MTDETTDHNDELLREARERFQLASDAENEQREQEKEDLRFQVPELQWSEEAKAERKGDGKLTYGRPMLSITQLDAPMRQTLQQARNSKLGVNIHPISENANQETAEVLQGLYRRIERDSNANDGRLWALDRAVKCSRGYYRVTTAYDEDAGDTFDQEIRIERILYQEGVYLDPAAQQPDWSDGEWAFVVTWVPLADFRRQFPKAQDINSELAWEGYTLSATPKWAKGGYGKDAAVLVAEYWFKRHKREEVKGAYGRKRERDVVEVFVAKLSGVEVLEEPQPWNGRYIPIIPVLGLELQPFDERRRFNGMVTTAKDAQRFFNYSASTLVESMAIEPKVPWTGTVKQIEGYEELWYQANIRNFGFLPHNPHVHEGQLLPPPSRVQVDGSKMQLAMLAMKEAGQMIQQTTAVHDPSLGRLTPEQRSGRAILALQQQGDLATGSFLSNLAVAMTYEARVVLDLIPAIYDRKGRITRIIRGDDEQSEAVALNSPFATEDGQVQVLAGMRQGAKQYNLIGARYGVSIDVGKSYQTRLAEGDEVLAGIIQAAPQLLEIIGPEWFRFRDHPGAKEIADLLAKLREMKYPLLKEGKDGQATPEQLQVQNQTLQQQIQQMTQQLQAMGQALELDKAKQEASLLKAQMETQSRERIAAAGNETALTKAAADNEVKLAIAGMETRMAAMEALLKVTGAAQDRAEAADERQAAMEGQALTALAQPPTVPSGEGTQG